MFFALTSLIACEPENTVTRIPVPPEVSITSPQAMAELRQGEGPQVFEGVVADEWDAVEALAVAWVLNDGTPMPTVPGPDGAVRLDLDVDGLQLGENTVGLEAVDTDGERAYVALVWTLKGPLSAPQVDITDPLDGSFFPTGTEITFRATVTDSSLDGLIYSWSSSLDGPLTGDISAKGQSALFTALSPGNHVVTLTVVDPDSELGQDSVSVSVGDIEEPAEPGDLVFSELMINPQVVADEVGEWVELYNTASYAIDIEGYTFHDLDFDEYVLEGSILVPGNGYVVLCANLDPALNGGVTCDAPFKRDSTDALALGNSGDEVILSRADGVVIDQVIYNSSWFSSGAAIGLDPSLLSSDNNDTEANWCTQVTITTSGGEPSTPGRENDPCQ